MHRRFSEFRFHLISIALIALLCCWAIPVWAISEDMAQTDRSSADTETASDKNPKQDKTKPRRAIVHVNRNLTIAGFIEELSDDVVVIRDRQSKIHSYSRSRVLTVIELVDPQPGQTGVVFLATGQSREGVIIEDHFEYVLMEIEGVRAKISRANVDHVVLEPTFAERYEQYKKSLLPGQTRRHLALCQWLIDNKAWELAKAELDALLTTEDSPDAKRLLNVVEAQLTLQSGGFKSTEEQRNAEQRAEDENDSGPVTTEDRCRRKSFPQMMSMSFESTRSISTTRHGCQSRRIRSAR